jgi:hypothetical protein
VETVRDRVQAARRSRAKTRAAGVSAKVVSVSVAPKPKRKKTAREFVWLWQQIEEWPGDFDPDVIAREVPGPRWDALKQTMAAGNEFADMVDAIRARLAEAAA